MRFGAPRSQSGPAWARAIHVTRERGPIPRCPPRVRSDTRRTSDLSRGRLASARREHTRNRPDALVVPVRRRCCRFRTLQHTAASTPVRRIRSVRRLPGSVVRWTGGHDSDASKSIARAEAPHVRKRLSEHRLQPDIPGSRSGRRFARWREAGPGTCSRLLSRRRRERRIESLSVVALGPWEGRR